jgi:hypothetical protein
MAAREKLRNRCDQPGKLQTNALARKNAQAEAAEYEAMQKESVAASRSTHSAQPHWTARKNAAEGDAERLAADSDASTRELEASLQASLRPAAARGAGVVGARAAALPAHPRAHVRQGGARLGARAGGGAAEVGRRPRTKWWRRAHTWRLRRSKRSWPPQRGRRRGTTARGRGRGGEGRGNVVPRPPSGRRRCSQRGREGRRHG